MDGQKRSEPTVNAATRTKRRPRQRISGDRRVALQGRWVTITVDRVLPARGKMLRNKANGPARSLVTEMLQCLPTEIVHEVVHWFDKRFEGECRATEAWTILRLVFLKKPDAKLEKGLRGFRAIALLSVQKKPVEWRRLHVGAERGVNCEHMQALVTNIFQRHLGLAGGQADRPATRNVQIQCGLCGRLGCEDSISGIEDSHLDRCPRTRGGCSTGRDAGCGDPRALRTAKRSSGTMPPEINSNDFGGFWN